MSIITFHFFPTGNYGNGSFIDLINNQGFTRFEANVFQLVLEKMAPFGGYPNAYGAVTDSEIIIIL